MILTDIKYLTSIVKWIADAHFCERVKEGFGDSDLRLAQAYAEWRYPEPTPELVQQELAQLHHSWYRETLGQFRIVRTPAQWCEEFTTPAPVGGEASSADHVARSFLSFYERSQDQSNIQSICDALWIAGYVLTTVTTRLLRGDVPRKPQFAKDLWGEHPLSGRGTIHQLLREKRQ